MNKGIDLAEEKYYGVVIGNEGQHFSAGADISMIFLMAVEQEYDELHYAMKLFQDTMMRMRYSSIPVVAAPHGYTFGGACELCLHCDRVIAHAETYVGLVEVGVGLIPGAGGNLRVLSNLTKKFKSGLTANFQVVQNTFETIGMAKFSMSAKEAQKLGYLTKEDEIVLNQQHLLKRAKDVAIEMSEGYHPPEPEFFRLPGTPGRLPIKATIKSFMKKGKISEHDPFLSFCCI